MRTPKVRTPRASARSQCLCATVGQDRASTLNGRIASTLMCTPLYAPLRPVHRCPHPRYTPCAHLRSRQLELAARYMSRLLHVTRRRPSNGGRSYRFMMCSVIGRVYGASLIGNTPRARCFQVHPPCTQSRRGLRANPDHSIGLGINLN